MLGFVFEPGSSSRSIYVPQAQQNSLQAALHSAVKYIQQHVRIEQSVTTQGSTDAQVQCCREATV